MKTFILPDFFDGSSSLTLGGREFHYLIRVLRLKKGDALTGLDKKTGVLYEMVVQTVTPGSCSLSCNPLSEQTHSEGKKTSVHNPVIELYQCIPKGRKFDQIIRQATEAGVNKIIPVLSERTVPKYDESVHKKTRWERIVTEALQQSGSQTVPAVADPQPFESIVDEWNGDGVGLLFHPVINFSCPLYSCVAESSGPFSLFIGPEGGFSNKEADFLLTSGAKPIYLGQNILRTETAALYAIASVQTVFAEKSLWRSKRRS